jgi:hypothetical protein
MLIFHLVSEGVFLKQRPADSSEAILREGWTNALNCSDNTGAKKEILCPEDQEYELDSDFEDDDEASSPLCGRDSDQATLEGRSSILILSARAYFETWTGQQSECGTEKSSSSLSSFVDGRGKGYIPVTAWFLNHDQPVTGARLITSARKSSKIRKNHHPTPNERSW